MVTIKCDVELDDTPDSLKYTGPDKDKLKELFSHFEFKTWLAEVLEGGSSDTAASKPEKVKSKYDTVLTEKDFNKWLKKLEKAKYFAFDTETTSLNYMQAEIVGVSFSVKAGEAAYVPVAHNYPGAPEQLSREFVLEKLKPLLEDEKKIKVGVPRIRLRDANCISVVVSPLERRIRLPLSVST